MTVTVIGLERVIKEDVVAVIGIHWTLVRNVTFHFVLNVLTIFSLGVEGRWYPAYPNINNLIDSCTLHSYLFSPYFKS